MAMQAIVTQTFDAPSTNDIIRYRYHHGTNLGSIYVLEKWLTPSAFPPGTPDDQTSELSCVSSWVKNIGVNDTKKRFEERWSKVMTDGDWIWLCNTARCTSIRLPIGYFTLGPDYCEGTPFEQYSAVYTNGWRSVKNFINIARERGVGVLIDLHALPGGANAGDHSGTNSKLAKLWNNTENLKLATRCIEFIAGEVSVMDGVIGIQLCNEATFNADGMFSWSYDQVSTALSTINPTIPLVISDAWDLGTAIDYIKSKNRVSSVAMQKQNPIVIDTHIYFCFDDRDKNCSPTQIISKVPSTLSELYGKTGDVLNTGAAGVLVGEYACTLDPKTWAQFPAGQDTDPVKKDFGNMQCEHYSSKAGGAFYWTLKMDWMDGDDWGFVAQTKSGGIYPPAWLSFSYDEVNGRSREADIRWQALRDTAYDAHVDYWDTSHPNGSFNHQLYKQGWELGWNDARAFFRCRSENRMPIMGADKIGNTDLWVLKRLSEFRMIGTGAWEFEHGMRKGIVNFEEVALA